jgi:histidinol-phosphate/aromatic aminotransferase/cobyric acid decarboxylase-like protein
MSVIRDRVADRRHQEQVSEGGRNGDAPKLAMVIPRTTICVLEGSLELEPQRLWLGDQQPARARIPARLFSFPNGEQIKQLLDGIPKDMPVLIDEAYHHFVDSADYESSTKYVVEGRPVIVCRTFSKIAALAAMRLGYGIGPADLIRKVRTFTTGGQSITVKFGGAASLKDTAGQAKTKALNKQIRDDTMAKLKALGYEVLPSEANFFMVGLKREVSAVAPEFQKRDVLVGRPFPPMTQHLRVSVGTQAEMDKFVAAFKEIMGAPTKATAGVQ